MTDKEDLEFLETLRTEFLDSAPGELDQWEESLLTYERKGDEAALKDLKRQVHSMKGSSQAIGFVETGEFCHLFEQWLDNNLSVKTRTQIVSHCLSVVDHFRRYFDAMVEAEDTASIANALKTILA
jgi:chemotaxis protein histidine kinase CheA